MYKTFATWVLFLATTRFSICCQGNQGAPYHFLIEHCDLTSSLREALSKSHGYGCILHWYSLWREIRYIYVIFLIIIYYFVLTYLMFILNQGQIHGWAWVCAGDLPSQVQIKHMNIHVQFVF